MKRISLVSLLLLPVITLGSNCDRMYMGFYYRGAEVNTFQPCGSDSTYWASASSWVLGPLTEYLQNHTSAPYQPVYIEMRGHMLDEKTGGFASQYDGLIRISEVIRQEIKIPATCEQHERPVSVSGAVIGVASSTTDTTSVAEDQTAMELGRKVLAVRKAIHNPMTPNAMMAVTDLGRDQRYYAMVRGWLSYQLEGDRSILDAASGQAHDQVKARIRFLETAIRAIDLE